MQWQSRRGSVRKPQGQGFSAATSMNSAGNVVDVSAQGDGDDPVLQRLPQHLQRASIELGQFVQEEDAVVASG